MSHSYLLLPSLLVCPLLLPNLSPITAASLLTSPSFSLTVISFLLLCFRTKADNTRVAQRFLSKLSLSTTLWVDAHNSIFHSPNTFFSLYLSPSPLSLDKASSPSYTFSCKQPSLLLKHYFHPPLRNSHRESNPVIREAKWSGGIAINFMLNPHTVTAPASSLKASVSSSLSKETTDHLFIPVNNIYLESITIKIYLPTCHALYVRFMPVLSPPSFFPHCFENNALLLLKIKGKRQRNKSESPGVRGSSHRKKMGAEK